jgi:hypothetical protein
MTTTIQVSRGLCAPLRDDVLTALKPFGVRVLKISARGEGHWHIPCPDWAPMPDNDPWVRKHIVDVTVSDAQAKWAERLLWQSNKMMLECVAQDGKTRPSLNPSLKWMAPPACTAGAHGTLGRGTMPTPWSTQKRQPRKRTTRRTRQQEQRQDGGLLGRLARWLR